MGAAALLMMVQVPGSASVDNHHSHADRVACAAQGESSSSGYVYSEFVAVD